MGIVRECEPEKGDLFANFAKTVWMAAACVLVMGIGVGRGLAQDDRTGVAKPEPATMTNADDSDSQVKVPVVPAPLSKPSAAVPMDSAPAAAAYPGTAPESDGRRPLAGEPGADRKAADDPDAGIVTHVPWLPNEIPGGVLLKVKLLESISTETARPGSPFSAELTEALIGDGRVYVPAGSLLKGRVTWTHSGSRISGGAAIHLEARSVVLPDGTEYPLRARVIDTSSWTNTKVDSEGTIKRKEHTKGTLAAVGLATGGGAAAGAMIGGVPGALIGAGVGAGVSTVVWLKQERQAVLPKDLGVIFTLTAPMTMTPASSAMGTRGAAATPGGE